MKRKHHNARDKNQDCIELHQESARHFVSAAYFQQQAAASHLSGKEDEAKKHSAKSHEEAAMAQKIAESAGKPMAEKHLNKK
jgi:hypothetical protein